jgi:hypothetical protein
MENAVLDAVIAVEEINALVVTALGYTPYPITGPPDDLLVPKFVKWPEEYWSCNIIVPSVDDELLPANIIPLTSNFDAGVAVPIPTLPSLPIIVILTVPLVSNCKFWASLVPKRAAAPKLFPF